MACRRVYRNSQPSHRKTQEGPGRPMKAQEDPGGQTLSVVPYPYIYECFRSPERVCRRVCRNRRLSTNPISCSIPAYLRVFPLSREGLHEGMSEQPAIDKPYQLFNTCIFTSVQCLPRKAQEDPGRPRKTQEGPGRPRKTQEDPGWPRMAQEGPGRPRKALEGPGNPARPRKAQEGPGRPRKAQEDPGRPRKTQEGPGRPRKGQEGSGRAQEGPRGSRKAKEGPGRSN
jgi:hypothetical protein